MTRRILMAVLVFLRLAPSLCTVFDVVVPSLCTDWLLIPSLFTVVKDVENQVMRFGTSRQLALFDKDDVLCETKLW